MTAIDPVRIDAVQPLARETLVISPTFQERESIESHVRSVFEVMPEVSLLVVDDDSPDGTASLVESLQASGEFPRLHLLRRPPPRSFTGSYLDGMGWAMARGFTRVVSMDADGSHSPLFLPALLDLSREVDCAVGSRYLFGVSVLNWPLRRVLLSAFANVYAMRVTGIPINDLTAGYCCYRTTALRSIDLGAFRSSGYAYQIEMKYRIWRAGGVLGETNIVFLERRGGTSKMSGRRIVEGVLHPWWCRFVLGRPPAPPPVVVRLWDGLLRVSGPGRG